VVGVSIDFMNAPRVFAISRVWMCLIALAWGGSAAVNAAVPQSLNGDWEMIDETPSLMHPSNKESFKILRAVPGKSQWADGSFFLKWTGAPRSERGYYSLKTGRVWVTTYRWVDEKRERVEYQGLITEEGEVVWSGIAKTTGHSKTSWDFTATKH
jgi:hypothetical protein